MGFFENANNVQIHGGQFRDIHGDLYEYRDQRYNHSSFNSDSKLVHGAFNGASSSHNSRLDGAPFSKVNFEDIKKEVLARAGGARRMAVPVEQEYGPLRERPEDGFQGGRRHPPNRQPTGQMWNRRSPEPMDYDDYEENNLDSFQSSPSHRDDPFGWARAGTEPQQPQSHPQLGRAPRRASPGAYRMTPPSRTAPYPSPDPTRPSPYSPGYDPSPRFQSEDGFEQEQETTASNQYRPPRKGTNPFHRKEQNEAHRARYTRQVWYNPTGTNINSFNYTSTIIENSHNNDAEEYYDQESMDPRRFEGQWYGRN